MHSFLGPYHVIRRLALCLYLGLFLAPMAVQAADVYPSRPVRLVVPTPPGGTNDIIARTIAQQLTLRLGQSFIVDNRPGGNSVLGAEAVVRAAPDGYTLLCSWAGPLALNHLFNDTLGYDPATDLVPVSLLADVATVLVANRQMPADNLQEFVRYVRAHPGKVAMAISTIGSMPHLLSEQLRSEAGLDVTFVPYQGSGPAINDLLGNQTQAHFENLPAVIGQIRAGKLKALTVASVERSPNLPDVQTTAEAGYPRLRAAPRFVLAAPAGTPKAIVDKLNREVGAVLRDPAVVSIFERAGARPRPGTPAEAAAFAASERLNWKQVVDHADISIR